MPLTIIEQPPRYVSAYKPVRVGVTSTKSPNNTTPFESGLSIGAIKVADATDVSIYGSPLEEGDLFIFHDSTPIGTFPLGQTVKVTACDIPKYDGVHRVLKEVTDKVIVIDSENYGQAITGLLEKHYENFTVYARVTLQNGRQRTYDIAPDSSGVFYIDPSDFLRASFNDVFDLARGGNPVTMIDAETYITMRYIVNCFEAYNIPDANGVNVYTELEKNGDVANIINKYAVNSVQPYHHIDEATGTPDYVWDEDMTPYETEFAAPQSRFLTYHPNGSTYDSDKAHRCARTDAVWLAFLWVDTSYTDAQIRVDAYRSDGALITTYTNVTLDKKSYIFNAGPDALSVGSNAVRYSVTIYRDGVALIAPMWFKVDEACNAGTRFYIFNRFGAIDQYTADGGRLSRSVEVERLVTSKTYISKTLGVGGDYNRRTYATNSTAYFEQDTRTERKEKARWILDEVLTSPDVRIQVYDGDLPVHTHVILDVDKGEAGVRGQKYRMRWSLGVDNVRARR